MISAISGYFIRLFIGGFAVFCVMAIAGKGGTSEPLRLCCACFMIILILTPGLSAGDIISELSAEAQNTEAELENAVKEGTNAAYDKINRGVEEYVSGLVFKEQAGGKVKIEYTIDEDGGYIPVSVKVKGQCPDRVEALTAIGEATGLTEEKITFEG